MPQCYVCKLDSKERLTKCISAVVYQVCQKGVCKEVTNEYGQQVTTSELHEWFQKGGNELRIAEGDCHCHNYFHQSCLDRRPEASNDLQIAVSRTVYGVERGSTEQELYVKDIRHRLCLVCLLLVQSDGNTQYSGALPGKKRCCRQTPRASTCQCHNLMS